MGNGEQSGSDGRSAWPVRLAGMVGACVFATLGLLLKSQVDLGLGPWQGAIAFGVLVGVGIVLGQLVGSLLFRWPPDR
jgi:hypothetical protein